MLIVHYKEGHDSKTGPLNTGHGRKYELNELQAIILVRKEAMVKIVLASINVSPNNLDRDDNAKELAQIDLNMNRNEIIQYLIELIYTQRIIEELEIQKILKEVIYVVLPASTRANQWSDFHEQMLREFSEFKKDPVI